jgi:FkbM family methyltransferase
VISYAQNFEDVMLWRALRHVEHGFYIDIGAQDPVVDSVSLAFYEHGWRGVHVEPTPAYAQALRDARPDETVVQAAVGDESALIPFFEIPGTGLSTGDVGFADKHRAAGYAGKRIDVPCIQLSSLLDKYQDRDIHWMKIDVEGMEASVLRSWLPSTVRPWVLVLESTLPLSQELSHGHWEPLVFGLGYQFAYFDGLNRFYVSELRRDLLPHFDFPPNVFDCFSLSGTSSNTFCTNLTSALATAKRESGDLRSVQTELISQITLLREDGDTFTKSFRHLELTTVALAQVVQSNRDLAELVQQIRAQEDQSEPLRKMVFEGARRLDESRLLLESERAASSRFLAERDHLNAELREAIQRIALVERDSADQSALASSTAQAQALAHRAELLAFEEASNAKRLDLIQQHHRLHAESEARHATDLRGSEARYGELTLAERSQRVATESLLEDRLSVERAASAALRRDVAELQAELTAIRGTFLYRLSKAWTAGQVDQEIALDAGNDEARSAGDTSANVPPSKKYSVSVDRVSSTAARTVESMLGHTMNHHRHPARRADTVEELLAHYDEAFVVCAYWSILGRHPDLSGLATYVAQARDGESKAAILAALAFSEEGRSRNVDVRGLERLIGSRKNHIVSRFSWALRRALGKLVRPTDFRLRALENRLGVLDSSVIEKADKLEVAIADLRQILMSGLTTNTGRTDIAPPRNSPEVDSARMGLSSRASRVYDKLTKSASLSGGYR